MSGAVKRQRRAQAPATEPIAVRAGQVYRCVRRGKPPRHVRVTRVTGKESAQPRAHLVEVTRSGRRKGRAADPSIVSFLHLRAGAWRLGPGYEVVPW